MPNTKVCRACGGQGGFNIFQEMRGEGTSTYTVHEWVECNLCKGTGKEEE